MPPKRIPAAVKAAKRKSSESSSVSKRVKLDLEESNASPDLSSPQKKNSVLKLYGRLPDVPKDAYVNPKAKALFQQVEVHFEASRHI